MVQFGRYIDYCTEIKTDINRFMPNSCSGMKPVAQDIKGTARAEVITVKLILFYHAVTLPEAA